MTSILADQTFAKKRFTGRGETLLPNEPQTIAKLFIQAASKHDRKNALNFKQDGEWKAISSSEMLARIENIALGLYSIGLRKGDKAAVIAGNSPVWTLTDAGCQFAGVIDVPIYTTLAPNSVCYIIKDSAAKVFFIENKAAYDRIAEILPECASVETIIFFDPAGIETDNSISLAELETAGNDLRTAEPQLLADLTAAVDADDLATLIYTSGTTGEPKGVMLTHTNIVSNVIDSGEKYKFTPDDIPLSVLPLSHIFERSAMYVYIMNGMAVYYAESVDKAPENLREVRPTIFVGVPRIFEKVYAKAKLTAAQAGETKEKIFDWAIDTAKQYALCLAHGEPIPLTLELKHKVADKLVYSKFRDFFGNRLRFCITGGAALPDEIYLIFTGSGVGIMQGYGLTETSPVLTSNNPSAVKLGTVGRPIRNTQVRIAADGEVEAFGPGILIGYYNKEEATHEAFTDDGWFRTGDIGDIDDEGFLRITDRKKELFKTSGGKYIAPSPIEQMIRSSRFVNQAVLVGNGRKFASALIVPNFEQLAAYAKHKDLDLKTPDQFCASPRILDLFERQIAAATKDLSRFEQIKKIALLQNELTVDGGELTPTLKVKRRIVDEKYRDVIEKIYAEAEANPISRS